MFSHRSLVVAVRTSLTALLMVGCGGDDSANLANGQILLADYHMLDVVDTSMVFRFDEGEDAPDSEDLVVARVTEEGLLKFRGGDSWSEGDDIGSLLFNVSDGLKIKEWDLMGSYGEGPAPMASAMPMHGEVTSKGDWSCELNLSADTTTYYATFDRVAKL